MIAGVGTETKVISLCRATSAAEPAPDAPLPASTVDARGIGVVHAQLVSVGGEVRGDRTTDVAETNEAETHLCHALHHLSRPGLSRAASHEQATAAAPWQRGGTEQK